MTLTETAREQTGSPVERTRPRVYLAGPDVFLSNAIEVGAAKTALLDRYGLEGAFPLDAEIDVSGLPPHEQATRIALANEEIMRSCSAIIANISPFRGVSMDCGTAYEVGFMRARGCPIAAYSTSALPLEARTEMYRISSAGAEEVAIWRHADIDTPDIEVEAFGLAENLMIAIAVRESGATVETGSEVGPAGILAFDAFERSAQWLSKRLQQAA